MNKAVSLFFFCAIFFHSNAQMPDTELILFKIKTDKEKKIILRDSINITNRPGYDNQPSFSADGKKIYYVSVREDKQADIYSYDLKKKKTLRLTNTSESEYSPVNYDEETLTSVVVEKDSAQKIHFINVKNGNHERILDFDSVGYYAFINPDTLIYYKLTKPHSLRYHCISTGEDKWIGDEPVRGFKKINRHRFVYGLRAKDKVNFYQYDFLLQKAEPYCEYQSFNEDIIWHKKFGLMKSEGNKIMRYDEIKRSWDVFFDLSNFGIKKITRFIFDQEDQYFVVVNNL